MVKPCGEEKFINSFIMKLSGSFKLHNKTESTSVGQRRVVGTAGLRCVDKSNESNWAQQKNSSVATTKEMPTNHRARKESYVNSSLTTCSKTYGTEKNRVGVSASAR